MRTVVILFLISLGLTPEIFAQSAEVLVSTPSLGAKPAVTNIEAIPRDPLPGAATAPKPLSPQKLNVALIVPGVLLLAFWLTLALYRAWITDPVRHRRQARKHMRAALSRLSRADSARPELLHAWQESAIALWELHRTAPATRQLQAEDWAQLWTEADHALYGRTPGALPQDWTQRAKQSLNAKRVVTIWPLRALLKRNLLPAYAASFVLVLMSMLALRAESTESTQDPVQSYLSGDFATAEKLWTQAIQTNSTDWIAHHNVSLALSQSNKDPGALAHAAAAFLQHPRDASVRWHLAKAIEKSSAPPAPLAEFAQPSILHRLAQFASPAEWQRTLIWASALFAIALALLLIQRYGWRAKAVRPLAFSIAIAAILTAAIGTLALKYYGPASDARAVIVAGDSVLRSIPTDLDSQKTASLPAGSIALAGRSFLGWVHLTFDNQQTGWVRAEELLSLWQPLEVR